MVRLEAKIVMEAELSMMARATWLDPEKVMADGEAGAGVVVSCLARCLRMGRQRGSRSLWPVATFSALGVALLVAGEGCDEVEAAGLMSWLP